MSPRLLTLLLLFATAVFSTPLTTHIAHSCHSSHSEVAPNGPHGTRNDSYIVMLKPTAVLQRHLHFLQLGNVDGIQPLVDIKNVYGELAGYSGHFSKRLVDKIRALPDVKHVERDTILRTQDTQIQAPWGLARVSHRDRLTFSTFTRYEHDPAGGQGVDVYVLDTGINIRHTEFEGRASWGASFSNDGVDDDTNGHGTHCAGTIASRRYGVAKAANVIAVKVIDADGHGALSNVLAGLDFAIRAARTKRDAGDPAHRGSVINISLGGDPSRALDDGVNAAVDSGIHVAVAAGNDNEDACRHSPASAYKAVTVGASTLGDERASFSNFGACVDVFAPGQNILSTYTGSTTASTTLSGTSMATPHTAGMLAYLLSLYPCKTFNPLSEAMPPVHLLAGLLSSPVYIFLHAGLPRWVSGLLPMPIADASNSGPVAAILTPAQLKRELLTLASADKLHNLPSDTSNLIIFNNATIG
ncbi:peptidase S8/S53 domain-containing protein [Mycena crocata]|nr:peptidase S8/S53 domain-containing protein [Mycena crocata]